MNDYIRKLIKIHALEDVTKECCGIIIAPAKGNMEIYPCKNISLTKEKRFEISPLEYLKAVERGKVVGFYHSHISENDKISLVDKHYSEGFKLPIVLYSIKKDSFDFYHPKGSLLPYMGESFEIGVNDCFTLARKYFKNELNIEIQDYSRDEHWYEKNPGLILENFEKEGFVQVKGQPQIHDVIFFRMKDGDKPSHIAIYVDGGRILHHPRYKNSRIEEYDQSFINRTFCIARHKSLL